MLISKHYEYTYNEVQSFVSHKLGEEYLCKMSITFSNPNGQYTFFARSNSTVLPIINVKEESYGLDLHISPNFLLKIRFANESMYANMMSLMTLAENLSF
jgi:hypothetical protein